MAMRADLTLFLCRFVEERDTVLPDDGIPVVEDDCPAVAKHDCPRKSPKEMAAKRIQSTRTQPNHTHHTMTTTGEGGGRGGELLKTSRTCFKSILLSEKKPPKGKCPSIHCAIFSLIFQVQPTTHVQNLFHLIPVFNNDTFVTAQHRFLTLDKSNEIVRVTFNHHFLLRTWFSLGPLIQILYSPSFSLLISSNSISTLFPSCFLRDIAE